MFDDDDDPIVAEAGGKALSSFANRSFLASLCCFSGFRRDLSAAVPFSNHKIYSGSLELDVKQNYKATFYWTSAAALLAMGVLAKVYWKEGEENWFNNLSALLHTFTAVITLVGIAAVFSAMVTVLMNCFKERATKQELEKFVRGGDVSLVTINSRDGTPMSMSKGVINPRTGHSASSLHPVRLCFPLTPKKMFAWSFMLSSLLTTVVCLSRRDLFQKVVNSDFASYGALATLSLGSSAVAGGVATMLHAGGAWIYEKAASCRGSRDATDYLKVEWDDDESEAAGKPGAFESTEIKANF